MSAIPKIVMHQVESSQFAAIGHAPELSLLAIQFHPKKSTGQIDIYHYQNFSAEMFAEFLGAESQGSFFIQRIKKFADQFPYSKIDQAAFSHTAPQPVAKQASLAEAAPVKLSKELLAGLLTGREYGKEMLKEEEMQAKAAGLIVIFGASDDLMEFRGFVYDERYAPTVALIDAKGLLPFREDIEHNDEALKDYWSRTPRVRAVDAMWAKEEGYSWTYRTTIPHATFEIVEDGEPYCRGIVIDVADLGGAA